jgi:hypothetical protein
MSETKHIDTQVNNGAGHEHTDADVGALAKFGIGLAALTAVVFVLMLLMLGFLRERKTAAQAPPHPLAEREQTPPQPRLQIVPELDLEKLRAREDSLLNSYGWMVKEAGVVRIPIDSAMALLARGEARRSKIEDGGSPR